MSRTVFSENQLETLPKVISPARFETYLTAANSDSRAALKLYEWNLLLSAAFMVPIGIVEIVLRNAINDALTNLYGEEWPWNPGFLRELPNPTASRQFNPRRELISVATRYEQSRRTGKVVAELKFVFWEKLLRAKHHGTIWSSQFSLVFPNGTGQAGRDIIRSDVEELRALRNRIAHHEPILSRNLTTDLDRARRIVSFVHRDVEAWFNEIETVSAILKER